MIELLKNNEAFKEYEAYSNNLGNLNMVEEALMIINAFYNNNDNLLIIKNNLYNAQKLYNFLKPLLKENCFIFQYEESLRINEICSSPEMKAQRIEILNDLISKNKKVCICDISSALTLLPNPNNFKNNTIHIKKGIEYNYRELIKKIISLGYEKNTYIDQPLTFANRGDVIDIFSLNYENPIRLEFFGDEIESIRFFDINTKKTIKEIEEVTIISATDLIFDENEITVIKNKVMNSNCVSKIKDDISEKIKNNFFENNDRNLYGLLDKKYTLKDYLEKPKIILSSIEEIESHNKMIYEENISYIQEMSAIDEIIPIYDYCEKIDVLYKNAMIIKEFLDINNPVDSQVNELEIYEGNIEKRIETFKDIYKNYEFFYSVSKLEAKILKAEYGITKFIEEEFIRGFVANKEKIVVLTSRELFDVKKEKTRFKNKFNNAEQIDDYLKLENGDFIIHKIHGVGKYLGIETKEKNGIHKDYLKIAYKGNDILYVPLEQFKLVRKFVSKDGYAPKLNKLGGSEWKKTKNKVNENVKKVAEKLVSIYANRENAVGFAYPKDDEYQKEFEEAFPYELTKDQKQAVEEIKKDMESIKPMDRLLCGDVGFGKTEVAFIAAFKAILAGKQVAFLCPTTILSFQHYQTAMKRFENFPVNIKVINRFISSKEINKIKKELKEGKIDFLIGTHKLLGKGVEFKDLGLLIIDEEQRFGVIQKEKIKELKNSIDVLSMSATPIPRTLQMSLVGLRSLSQLNTPPKNRQSVQTYVVKKDSQLIKEVVERELARNGQVFYLFNNVKEIYRLTDKLSKLMPNVKIKVAHGQMEKEEIESIMYEFENHEFDMLISTTIIETGIDIPNANTILIENADLFGLSQLYQIKGRVGRSDRLGFAYLMYDPNKQMNEIAVKRLKTLKEFTKLGSGYKIALKDLSIRGAGEMLGAKQAGFIDTVGIDMYIEMLNQAISELKGNPISNDEEELEEKLNIEVDAYIPHNFEEEDYQKITLYQKIEATKNIKELSDLKEMTSDLYGKLPKEVKLLFEKRELEILLNDEKIDSFIKQDKKIEIIFTKKWSDNVDGIELFSKASKISKDIKISYKEQKIHVNIIRDSNYLKTIINFMNEV